MKHYANAARAVSRSSSRVAGRLGAKGRCVSEIIIKTVGPGREESHRRQRRIKFQREECGWKSLMICGLEIASTLDFFFPVSTDDFNYFPTLSSSAVQVACLSQIF